MAKGITVKVTKTTKVSAGKRTVNPVNRTPKPNKAMGGMSASQQYKLQKRALKNQAKAMKYNTKLEMAAIKGAPSKIESAGKAFAQASTPIAGSISANRAIENIEAGKTARTAQSMSSDELSSWKGVISGNPDREKGADGETQGKSTTTSTSGGSLFGG